MYFFNEDHDLLKNIKDIWNSKIVRKKFGIQK